ncbi:MAG: hypothetical protein LGB68_02255, partial [Sulfurovum sp.]|nr:hypothetical protein [Sulfurovum sp.]
QFTDDMHVDCNHFCHQMFLSLWSEYFDDTLQHSNNFLNNIVRKKDHGEKVCSTGFYPITQ